LEQLRVLFIEDSEDDCALQVRLLARAGYEVVYERVEEEGALEAALGKPWNVIISDFSMPHYTGMAALRLIRERGFDTPFIFVSGTIGEETAVSALKVGAQDYLMKTNLSRLVPAVQRELREADTQKQHKRMEAQVHQLQRFEAIGRLAGGVAHDFNNVIGAIMGWAEIGYGEAEEGSRIRERFDKIRSQAQRAAALTAQLLAFARRQILQPKNTDLNTLVSDEIALLRNLIGEKVEVQCKLAPELWAAWADAGQVEQVVMNLCLNARDAMANGGTLIVQTANVEIRRVDAGAGANAWATPGKYVLLSVRDNGPGMDEATLDHIFEPFFTTKGVGKGTGLGLATVYGIVKQHKGFIDVESRPGEGTAFRVYWPIGEGSAKEAEKKPEVAPVQSATGTILIAEDNDGLREAAKEILEAIGYTVILARDGLEAVKIFEKRHDDVDLLFMDVVMPGLNGPEAHQRMIAIDPNVPVIFTTGYASENNLINTVTATPFPILQKPYGSRTLAQKIKEVLSLRPKLTAAGS
jgi:two-component system, cell cycle sensor histidine kinase and response regulator CckA